MSAHQEILLEFLNTPLECADAIFHRFAALPNAVVGTGPEKLQRYIYIPGSRKDRIVLVAHTDTVWDNAYSKSFSGEQGITFENGIFSSANPTCGIGADDRAGCAMLWVLRDCGHSILLVDGEEHGKLGARYLRKSNPKLFRQLNRHAFMIELDWTETGGCLFNQVENTQKFKTYIQNVLGFAEGQSKGGCDLQVLCRDVCGVNLGIGYHNQHTPKECLVLSEWENTLAKLSVFLSQPQTRFPTKALSPYFLFCKRCMNKVRRILKKWQKNTCR